MPYIYKYTDTTDDTIKYIGIIKKDTNFPNRFIQHKRDTWNVNDDIWDIHYAVVPSVCDAEMLEGHLIEKYSTYNFHNTSKAEWGMCSFLSKDYEPKWKLYKQASTTKEDLIRHFPDNLFSEEGIKRYRQTLDEVELLKKYVDLKIKQFQERNRLMFLFAQEYKDSVKKYISKYLVSQKPSERKYVNISDFYEDYVSKMADAGYSHGLAFQVFMQEIIEEYDPLLVEENGTYFTDMIGFKKTPVSKLSIHERIEKIFD